MKIEYLVAAFCVAGVGYWLFFMGPHVSYSERERLGEACRVWMSERFADGAATRLGPDWNKRGRIVYEVRIARQDGGWTPELCVVDVDEGTMLRPSLLAVRDWAR